MCVLLTRIPLLLLLLRPVVVALCSCRSVVASIAIAVNISLPVLNAAIAIVLTRSRLWLVAVVMLGRVVVVVDLGVLNVIDGFSVG